MSYTHTLLSVCVMCSCTMFHINKQYKEHRLHVNDLTWTFIVIHSLYSICSNKGKFSYNLLNFPIVLIMSPRYKLYL